jgi:hypothetical protein
VQKQYVPLGTTLATAPEDTDEPEDGEDDIPLSDDELDEAIADEA